MENKNQTAVEWLKENLTSLFQDDSGHYQKLFAQAKEMEKEQIINAHLTGLIHPLEIEATKQAEQYYKETYGEEPNGS